MSIHLNSTGLLILPQAIHDSGFYAFITRGPELAAFVPGASRQSIPLVDSQECMIHHVPLPASVALPLAI